MTGPGSFLQSPEGSCQSKSHLKGEGCSRFLPPLQDTFPRHKQGLASVLSVDWHEEAAKTAEGGTRGHTMRPICTPSILCQAHSQETRQSQRLETCVKSFKQEGCVNPILPFPPRFRQSSPLCLGFPGYGCEKQLCSAWACSAD